MSAVTIGKYDVAEELGRGGMAVVYRAFDPVIRRAVALKVVNKTELAQAGDPSVLERFRREAQAAGNLQHPNIVGIYEYGEDGAYAFIAMELVSGQTLRDHLVGGWRPGLEALPEVLDQLLDALDYSHARGVIHRDVKPGNVLISDMGIAKISDFGIARIERSNVTQVGEVLGTPFYMSPEQFDGQPADERSDLYSAAVIVFEVLTGRRPFTGEGAQFFKQILHDDPPPPSSLNAQIPAAADAIVLKGLARDPGERYASVRDFSDALHGVFVRAPKRRTGAPAAVAPKAPGGARNLGALRRAIGAKAVAPSIPTRSEERAVAPKSGAAEAPAGRRRPKVLCVDDETRVLNALEFLFKSRYDVQTASSGKDALDLLSAQRFHVLVSDQRMPGMTGVELLREARECAPATVRVLLTGYADLAAIVGSVNDSEVFRFISKPWQQDDLLETVEQAIEVAIAIEASPPPKGPPPGASEVVTLVLEDDDTVRAVRQIAGTSCRVMHAPTLDDALAILAKHEVALLISDIESQSVDHTALLKVLKAEHPQTLVIVTTSASDSDLIINLINEARIFRFVNKPVNLAQIGRHLAAALERYHAFRKSPGLLKAQAARRVAAAAEREAGRSLLERLRGLGARFTSALKG